MFEGADSPEGAFLREGRAHSPRSLPKTHFWPLGPSHSSLLVLNSPLGDILHQSPRFQGHRLKPTQCRPDDCALGGGWPGSTVAWTWKSLHPTQQRAWSPALGPGPLLLCGRQLRQLPAEGAAHLKMTSVLPACPGPFGCGFLPPFLPKVCDTPVCAWQVVPLPGPVTAWALDSPAPLYCSSAPSVCPGCPQPSAWQWNRVYQVPQPWPVSPPTPGAAPPPPLRQPRE